MIITRVCWYIFLEQCISPTNTKLWVHQWKVNSFLRHLSIHFPSQIRYSFSFNIILIECYLRLCFVKMHQWLYIYAYITKILSIENNLLIYVPNSIVQPFTCIRLMPFSLFPSSAPVCNESECTYCHHNKLARMGSCNTINATLSKRVSQLTHLNDIMLTTLK